MSIANYLPSITFLITIFYIMYIINRFICGNNGNNKGKKLNDKVIFIYSALSGGISYYYIKDSISYLEGDNTIFNHSANFEFYGRKYNSYNKSFESIEKHRFSCRKIDIKKAYNIEEFKQLTGCK